MIVYLNDNFQKKEDAKISIYDHSFLYGDGIFETIRVYNKKILNLSLHLKRLKDASKILEINISDIPFEETIQNLLALNNIKDAIIRITVSRGEGKRGIDPSLCKKQNFVIMAEEFKGYPDSLYKNGISAKILNIRRAHPKSFPPIKSNNYLPNILGYIEAKRALCDDGIFLTIDGYVACGITSNIFIVKDDTLITPPLSLGILPGITRETVLKIARSIGLPYFEKKFKKDLLFKADEVFLTSTGYELMPISKIDNYVFKRKDYTHKLLSLYRELI